ncbi:hypothetical protein N2152v2_007868 [Parachlorella kessleri]
MAGKPATEDVLQRQATAWGSQELNALLDTLPSAQSLPRADSGGFLNSPKWRALLGMDDDAPMHLDSTTSTTLPLQQQRPKRSRDVESDAPAGQAGSDLPSPAKQARRDSGVSATAHVSLHGIIPRADSLLPFEEDFLAAEAAAVAAEVMPHGSGGEHSQILSPQAGAAAQQGTPSAPILNRYESLSGLPAAMASLAFGTPVTQVAASPAPAGVNALPSDAVARVRLVGPVSSPAAGRGLVPNECPEDARHPRGNPPLQAYMPIGGKLKPLGRAGAAAGTITHINVSAGAAGSEVVVKQENVPATSSTAGAPALSGPSSLWSPRQGAEPQPASSSGGEGTGAELAAQGELPSPSKQQRKHPHLITKSTKAVPASGDGLFTSLYRGVTRHKLTGRYEAHYWDSNFKRENTGRGGRTRGRQVYLGGYEAEEEAARAYDKAALAYMGVHAPTNFVLEDYAEFLETMAGKTPEAIVGELRRKSVGFARGQSQFRGVTRHHHQNKWEARLGRVEGNKYLYLGTFESPEEAARAYDRAAVKYRGKKAITNYDLSEYADILANPDAYIINPAPLPGHSLSTAGRQPVATSVNHQGQQGQQQYQHYNHHQQYQQQQQQQHWHQPAPQQQHLQQQQQSMPSGMAAPMAPGPIGPVAGAAPLHHQVALAHPMMMPPFHMLPQPWALHAVPHMLPLPPMHVAGGMVPLQGHMGTHSAALALSALPPGMLGMLPPGFPAQRAQHEAAMLSMAVPAGYPGEMVEQMEEGEGELHTPTAASNPTSPPALPAVPLLAPQQAPELPAGALQPIPKLPAIRTRQPLAAAGAAATGASPQKGAFPGLTPLAASLLSPLGLTADFWRDSPLGKELSRELSKLSQEDINKLLAGDASVFNSPTKAPGSSGGSDLWAAVQWLDAVDPTLLSVAPTPTSATEPAPGRGK